MQNVTLIEQDVHRKTWFQRFRSNSKKYGLAVAVSGTAVGAHAEGITMPDVDVSAILTYIGLLVAAVATVGSAVLMIYLAAKGIKAIRAAF